MKNLSIGCLVTIIAAFLSACSAPAAPSKAEVVNSASSQIRALPPANPNAYKKMKDMSGWRNPFLIIRRDGVGVYDAANDEQHVVKPEDLPLALSLLPASSWPYGRVVAVQENTMKGLTDEESVQVRRTRSLVAGTLQDLQVLIKWVPAS